MSDKNIKHLVEVDTHYPFHTSFTDDKKTDVKHGNYTLSISNADKHNMQKEGRAKLISSPNQDKMKHLEQHNALSTKIGTTTHIKVKNNKTGETSDHHVFQSNAGNKSLTSVSALNSPRKENEHNNVIHSFLSGKELTEMFTFKGFLEEKKLTPNEKRKKEEIALAIEKDNPDMPIDKKMAIATATAKRVAESADKLSLEEAIHPLDAHEILMKHGGRDADYHTLTYKQIESLDDEAKERGYKHNSLTGKSRPRAFHDQLTRIADRYVNKDGSFKPEMKDELKESLNNFYTNNKTGKSGQILSKNDTHTTIKYDNNRTEQVPNDKFEQTHTRIIH